MCHSCHPKALRKRKHITRVPIARAPACSLAAAAIAFVLLGAGCRRREPGAWTRKPYPNGGRARAQAARPETDVPLKYALVQTFESGMDGLKGIAIDAQDRVYLAGKDGVRVLDAGGRALLSWRTPGPARCVAVDEGGNVYVGLRTKVETYDSTGKPLASWGKEGRGPGEFGIITAVAVSGPNVLVADAGNRCVHRFDTTGDFIDEIGKRDREAGFLGLVVPSPYLDCAVDPGGFLHVTNPGQMRVEKYSLDGELVGFWGKPGARADRFCGCCNPTNIALMPRGRTVTAEKGIPRVKVYDSQARLLAFMGPEFFPEGAAGLDLAVDSQQRIYVAVPKDGKVRVFAEKGRTPGDQATVRKRESHGGTAATENALEAH